MKIIDLIVSPISASVAAPFLVMLSNLVMPSELPPPTVLIEPPVFEPATCSDALVAAIQAQGNIHWYKSFVSNALVANIDTPDILLESSLDLAYQSIVLGAEDRRYLVEDSMNAIRIGRSNPLCSPTD
jgi:hypothetical protein